MYAVHKRVKRHQRIKNVLGIFLISPFSLLNVVLSINEDGGDDLCIMRRV